MRFMTSVFCLSLLCLFSLTASASVLETISNLGLKMYRCAAEGKTYKPPPNLLGRRCDWM